MRAPWKPDRLGEAGEENPSATSYCRGDPSECDHALEQRRSQLMGTRARMADESRCTYQSRLRACGVPSSPTSPPRSPTAELMLAAAGLASSRLIVSPLGRWRPLPTRRTQLVGSVASSPGG